jgi:DNA-binding MarR family transcriptional regulator
MDRIARTCLCRRVQHASRAVGKRFDDALRPLGLNNWQFTLLMALGADAPRSVNQIAAELGMDRTTATKNLGLLAQRGLIEASADGTDRRLRLNLLTAACRP